MHNILLMSWLDFEKHPYFTLLFGIIFYLIAVSLVFFLYYALIKISNKYFGALGETTTNYILKVIGVIAIPIVVFFLSYDNYRYEINNYLILKKGKKTTAYITKIEDDDGWESDYSNNISPHDRNIEASYWYIFRVYYYFYTSSGKKIEDLCAGKDFTEKGEYLKDKTDVYYLEDNPQKNTVLYPFTTKEEVRKKYINAIIILSLFEIASIILLIYLLKRITKNYSVSKITYKRGKEAGLNNFMEK